MSWKKQTISEICQSIDCKKHDPIKDFVMDSTGCYVLIQVNQSENLIELAICSKIHEITHIFKGKTCQEIYYSIFEFEKNNKIEWFKEKTHIAYLGKELKKAELELNQERSQYYQE